MLRSCYMLMIRLPFPKIGLGLFSLPDYFQRTFSRLAFSKIILLRQKIFAISTPFDHAFQPCRNSNLLLIPFRIKFNPLN